MNPADRAALWKAIDRYVTACGGDPARPDAVSSGDYGNVARYRAVAVVESVVRRMIAKAGVRGGMW